MQSIVIETKRPSVDVSESKWETQAFGYADAFTRYVVLTNGLRYRVWRTKERAEPAVDLDFEAILKHRRLQVKTLTGQETAQVLFMSELSRENLWNQERYQDFAIPKDLKISLREEEGFSNLLEKLDFIINQLLKAYTLMSFSEYLDGFHLYELEKKNLTEEEEKAGNDQALRTGIEKEKRELEQRCRRFVTFHGGYNEWLKTSNREDDDHSRQVFCKETIYVLLNKILLIRICEDKGLIAKKISNSGIAMWREFATHLKNSYRDLLEFAYKDISQLYGHVFEKGVFDWYAEGDGELNRALNKVLYILNHFDFSGVNRDIQGKLYEKYLPKEERKRLGEFYTPDEVIDYILDVVEYRPDQEIEGKNLLDPACGSGGFLIKALNRLIERYRRRGLGPRQILDNSIGHIFGLDVNAFACHIDRSIDGELLCPARETGEDS